MNTKPTESKTPVQRLVLPFRLWKVSEKSFLNLYLLY